MLNLQHQTFLQKVLAREQNTFVEERINTIQSINGEPAMVNGDVLYKIPINRTSTQDLLKNYTVPAMTSDRMEYYSSSDFLERVTTQVINVEKQKGLKQCISVIKDYYEAAGTHFYGAVIRRGSKIINPLHILSVLALLEDEDIEKETFTVSLYFYHDRENMDILYSSWEADKEAMAKNIEALMLTYNNKIRTQIQIENVSEITREGNVTVTYRDKKHEDEDTIRSHYIVTHQILTQGILAPYYGTSIIGLMVGGETKGAFLSPMRSPNIGQEESIKKSDNTLWASVCTGSLDSTTLTGLRSLTHANLSSRFSSYNLMPGLIPYVDLMIAKSFEVYAAAGIIDEIPVFKEPALYTDAELACTTLAEFLVLQSTTSPNLSPMDVENKFDEMLEYIKGTSDE